MKPEEIATTAMLEADPLLSYLEADKLATAALRALEEAGWVCVPREPTPKMVEWATGVTIGFSGEGGEYNDYLDPDTVPEVWRAMLDAAGGAN